MYHYNYEKRLQRTTQYMFTDPLNLPLPSTSIHSLPSLWSRAPRSCNTKQTLGSFIEQIVNLLGLNGIWRDILGHSGIWMGDELQNHELSIIERMVDLPAIREDLYVYYIHIYIHIYTILYYNHNVTINQRDKNRGSQWPHNCPFLRRRIHCGDQSSRFAAQSRC